MFKPIVPLAIFSTAIALFSPLASHADTLLVGTQLPSTSSGAELCVNCELPFEEFSSPVAFDIDDIKLGLLGPAFAPNPTASFTVSIFSAPANPDTPNIPVGTGEITFANPNQLLSPYVFDFSNLNILIQPNVDYYLEINGDNLNWAAGGSPLSNELGSIGPVYACDQAFTCFTPSRWDSSGGGAMQISGNVVTPEPAGWLLLGTGVLAIWPLRKRLKRS
jgi:hypothetical protein